MTRSEIFVAINEERRRQRELHGAQAVENPDHSDFYRAAVLGEEVGEVCKAVNEREPLDIQRELIQVAATAIAWLEAMD